MDNALHPLAAWGVSGAGLNAARAGKHVLDVCGQTLVGADALAQPARNAWVWQPGAAARS